MAELRQLLITLSVLSIAGGVVECQYPDRRYNSRGNRQSDVVFPDDTPARYQNDDSGRTHRMFNRDVYKVKTKKKKLLHFNL